MNKLKVRRETWMFRELMERWGIRDEADMRRLIIQGEVRPFSYFRLPLQLMTFVDGGPVPIGPETLYEGRLWLAQETGIQTGNHDYLYPVLRTTPDHEDGAAYWALPASVSGGLLSLGDVLDSFVVSDENRQEVEDAHRLAGPERSLGKREEKTVFVMLVTMFHELYGWQPGDPRSTGATELVHAAKELGFSLSLPTVRKYLELSWEQCPPRLELVREERPAIAH